MAKAADAFRTISEVSELLDTPTHVLRFWESKFSQIKPVKRAGGRRYYRPQDISLLGGIKHLLHDQGMTIKAAQKLLRENGVKHDAGLVDAPLAAPDAEQPATAKPKAVVKPKVVAMPAPEVAPVGTQSFFDFFEPSKKDAVRAKSNKIAPLVARLETVHARMR